MDRDPKKAGFTLMEMLISILILGIIVIGLERVLGTALSSYTGIKDKQDLLIQARLAMERMVMFVQETDEIVSPTTSNEEVLKVSERLLDTYNNSSHAYAAAGDGIPDADNGDTVDGLVNEGGGDAPEYMTFDLDKTDGSNWKLMEQMPDYSTAPSGLLQRKVICEHVQVFQCTHFSSGLVLIKLTLNNGKANVSLQTRARARLIE